MPRETPVRDVMTTDVLSFKPDDKVQTAWDWSRVGPSFHEFQKFGTLVFE